MGQVSHDDKSSDHVEQPSINMHDPRGFDPNIEINRGWSQRVFNFARST